MIVPTVVSQYAEEVPFLWTLRAHATRAPQYALSDLARLDERIEAHLDGLLIAGGDGWLACERELEWKEAGEVFTAAVLAIQLGGQQRFVSIREVSAQGWDLARGLAAALEWLPANTAAPYLAHLLQSDAAVLRAAGMAAAALTRQDPGARLDVALQDQAPVVRVQALIAAGELGRRDTIAAVAEASTDEDHSCRFAAARSLVLLGDERGIDRLHTIAEQLGSDAGNACAIAARAMPRAKALEWRETLAAKPEFARLAIIAAAACGDPALVPWLIEQCRNVELGRLAGEAISYITGVDISYENLHQKTPPRTALSGPSDNPEDDKVDLESDDGLPLPDEAKMGRWWAGHASAFESGAHLLAGRPCDPNSLQGVLKTARQRQRAAAAWELALQSPGLPLFNVGAPARRQRKELGLPLTWDEH